MPLPYQEYDVLGLGAVAVDDLLFVDEFPQPNGKTRVRSWARSGGGLAGTALVAAARLGASVAYCGVLGDDDLSRFMLRELERQGIDCSLVARRDGARPYRSVVIVARGSSGRSILFSGEGVHQPDLEELPESLIASAKVLFIDHTVVDAGIRAAEIARSLDIQVVADVEAANFPGRDQFLTLVDHLIVGLELARALTNETEPPVCVSRLLDYGGKAVVVTDGERGCWYASHGQAPAHLPALVVPVIDSTGCGDVFHGAYAACLSWGGQVDEAVRAATAAAGLKASHSGGWAGIPSRSEIETYLNKDLR